MANFAPKELLIERGTRAKIQDTLSSHYLTTDLDDWIFTTESAMERLLKQFGTSSLKGFGIHNMADAIIAAGAIICYLDITQHTRISHINSISRIEEDRYVRLDRFTVRNLELIDSLAEDGKSLLDVIDRTVSPMGRRMLRRWMLFPLKDVKATNGRLDIVERLFPQPGRQGRAKISPGTHRRPRTTCVKSRRRAHHTTRGRTGKTCPASHNPHKGDMHILGTCRAFCHRDQLNPCLEIAARIARELRDDAPNTTARGDVIASGIDTELDDLREIAFRGKDYLMKLQARESESTGIPSLKIGYNNVFGYYIEVTNTHKAKVPQEWIRKQTLVNAERYITQELKEYEEKILGAQEKILAIENRIFNDLVAELIQYIPAMQLDSTLIAQLDCLSAFTRVAIENRYNRPVIDDSLDIVIEEGRHPVIEKRLPAGEPYISNSVSLSNDGTQIMMITGPNMSGKSALLRQTAINVLLAQIGSFVAAQSARIGIVDKIFTRVGASDNISLGESTFMVEMNEAALILNNMSPRSLILFDELGRGTSTYDGISIAWAIVEHIHNWGDAHPKTLFATHYHELNEMERSFPRVVNYNVSVKEINGKVVFLRKLSKGGSEHSFGIHVAKLAGMPPSIVRRADEVLHQLETANRGNSTIEKNLVSLETPHQECNCHSSSSTTRYCNR